MAEGLTGDLPRLMLLLLNTMLPQRSPEDDIFIATGRHVLLHVLLLMKRAPCRWGELKRSMSALTSNPPSASLDHGQLQELQPLCEGGSVSAIAEREWNIYADSACLEDSTISNVFHEVEEALPCASTFVRRRRRLCCLRYGARFRGGEQRFSNR